MSHSRRCSEAVVICALDASPPRLGYSCAFVKFSQNDEQAIMVSGKVETGSSGGDLAFAQLKRQVIPVEKPQLFLLVE